MTDHVAYREIPTNSTQSLVESAIRSWRDSLINLAGTNRLLNFRPSRSSTIEIIQPAAVDVLSLLTTQRTLKFRSLAPYADALSGEATLLPPPATDTLDTLKDEDELIGTLRLLTRRANRDYLDRGVWVLHVAFGMLRWAEEDGTTYASPLLLVPVRLVKSGLRQRPMLEAADEDPVVNPALALKLSQYGVTLPGVDLLEDLSLAGLLGEVRSAVKEHSSWHVGSDVVLSCFSFHKEAMYRDLIDHEPAIGDHPIVRALALGGGRETDDFLFEEIPAERIDLDAPPESTPVVLDADSWQRSCVAAALDGRSFVMDGPPGTGKSQTIANMIAALLHAGKTVLFVSEKAAALEVVKNRLTNVGLGPYLLELHSHKATRREVATELGAALDTVAVAPPPMSAIALAKLRRRREELSAYAEAMNVPRPPLGYSLHAVIGMIALLRDVPVAPATGSVPVDLTVETLEHIRETGAGLANAWRPAVQGKSFAWRGVVERRPLDAQLFQASTALDRLSGIAARNTTLMDALDLRRPSDAGRLAAVLDHLGSRPAKLPTSWLTMETLAEIRTSVQSLEIDLAAVAEAEEATERAAGVPWHLLPDLDAVPEETAPSARQSGQVTDGSAAWTRLGATEARRLADSFRHDAERLDARMHSLGGITAALGLQPVATYSDAEDVLAVAGVASSPDRPERQWLSAKLLAAAESAAHMLGDAIARVSAAESSARRYFTEGALHADLDGLARRFATEHKGIGRLSSHYRADKRVIAELTAGQTSVTDAIAHLGLVLEWQRARAALADLEARHAKVLGSYYTGRGTDFDRLRRALANAATAVRRAKGADLSQLADHIASGGQSDTTLAMLVNETRRELVDWTSRLTSEPVLAGRPELLDLPLVEVAGWLRSEAQRLESAAELTHAISRVLGRRLTVGEASHIAALRAAAAAAHASLTDRAPTYSALCEGLFDGVRTDRAALHAALAWTERARTLLRGRDTPFSPVQVKALDTANPTPALAEAASTWNKAAAELRQAFNADRQAELERELDDYDDAAGLLTELRSDPAGREEWFAYTEARAALAANGLDVAVEFCLTERVSPELIPQVISRAVLQEWVDYHFQRDPVLRATRPRDRDKLIAEFGELDRVLVGSAVSDIITAVNRRRPRNDIGQAALIRREASKKKRHMPVRTLIDRASHVVQAIKPCFMMSPLSVSQYLPADLQFDVVIFDEASQLMPGDAINCVYRGRAMVTAGDQNQLPPTTFFTSTTDDPSDEWSEDSENAKDFESILDLVKAAGVFKSLPLRWHYRSKHEGLIAFSNASFYNGRLITFPSAEHNGGNVGVELFVVDGTYRRGSTRDNPVEAAKVAERVIHHYDTRPGLTLGVVTFSEAQAAAVEMAVEQARMERPDLDDYFTDDRLGGFFVKNLESVQGDERDVMIFSVGYGPDEDGRITMNFGPINRPGGWRRLNVAITRARHRVEVVSSITAAEISEMASSEGVRHLRSYLDYAARGSEALNLEQVPLRGPVEAPFEESVIETIRSWGYEVTPHVGAAGYRIDVGVHHPELPGRFLLGVECDGPTYDSAKAARDRDRLRAQVLRGLGWRLHRIWGTAWYANRTHEERRLRAAIETAVAEPAPPYGFADGPIERPEVTTESATVDSAADWAVPYEIAVVDPLPSWVDASEIGAHFEMRTGVRQIAATESPVHISVVHQRLRDAWNIGRVGARIRDNIDSAIRHADLLIDGDFVLLPYADAIRVRTPTEECARGVEQVHDDELTTALVNFVRDAGGINQDQLISAIATLFGWTRRRSEVARRLEPLVAGLLDDGTLSGTVVALTATRPDDESAGANGHAAP